MFANNPAGGDNDRQLQKEIDAEIDGSIAVDGCLYRRAVRIEDIR